MLPAVFACVPVTEQAHTLFKVQNLIVLWLQFSIQIIQHVAID